MAAEKRRDGQTGRAESTGDDTDKPQFAIQRIYIKDISFETPNSPAIFREKWEPEINLNLTTSSNDLGEDTHEVTLALTVTAKLGEKTAYLVEIQQAGIFTLRGFGAQEFNAMRGSYIPSVLFPFAREAVSDLVTRGGFPQMLLSPINFEALYAQHLERQRNQQAGAADAPGDGARADDHGQATDDTKQPGSH